MIFKSLPLLFILLLTACTAPTAPRSTERPLGNLDRGRLAGWDSTSIGATEPGWTATAGAKIELSTEHAPPHQHSLKATLSPSSFPGFSIDASSDRHHGWSDVDAIRFTLFSDADLKLNFRVDESASKDFATRYQSDMPLHVAKGDNELEISIAALRQGNLFSRGIDVGRIKSLRFFFPGVKQESTVYLSNIRYVTKSGPALSTPLVLLVNPAPVTFEAKDATTLTTVDIPAKMPPSIPFHKLKIEIAANARYPGVTLYHFPHDFLGYHFLAFNLAPVGDAPMPDNVFIKLTDANGRKMTFSTSLAENHGHVQLPLELAGQLELGNIKELSLFFANADNKSVYLEGIWLERHKTVDFPTIHADAIPDPALTLDFKPIQALGKNSVFMAMIAVPLANGKTRIIRCNSENKGITEYQIPAAALQDAKPNAPIQVWAYLIEHGVWHFRQTTLPEPFKVLTFSDPRQFNH